MYSVSRYLLSALLASVAAFALSAQPASARQHGVAAHRGAWHHYRYAVGYRYRTAHYVTHRRLEAGYATAYDESRSYAASSPFGYEAPAASSYSGDVAAMAGSNGVPVSLVERVIKRESGGNPRAVSAGNFGLMQIRLGTARAMGYGGTAAGLLDPVTNMTYAVRYLAGAYRAAGGNADRAVALYARGYNAAPVRTAAAFTDATAAASRQTYRQAARQGSRQQSWNEAWNEPSWTDSWNAPARTFYDYQAPYLQAVAYRVVHRRRHPA